MEALLNIKQVRDVLDTSAGVIIGYVQRGELPAYRFAGGRVERQSVTRDTTGLRFKPSDVLALIEKQLVK